MFTAQVTTCKEEAMEGNYSSPESPQSTAAAATLTQPACKKLHQQRVPTQPSGSKSKSARKPRPQRSRTRQRTFESVFPPSPAQPLTNDLQSPEAEMPYVLAPPATSCRTSPEEQAAVVKLVIVPAAFAAAMNLDRVGAVGFKTYLEQLLHDAGNPHDPVEIMLIQQIALCHLRSAELHGQAGQAKALAAVELYNTIAAKFTAELRKTALALKAYRCR